MEESWYRRETRFSVDADPKDSEHQERKRLHHKFLCGSNWMTASQKSNTLTGFTKTVHKIENSTELRTLIHLETLARRSNILSCKTAPRVLQSCRGQELLET